MILDIMKWIRVGRQAKIMLQLNHYMWMLESQWWNSSVRLLRRNNMRTGLPQLGMTAAAEPVDKLTRAPVMCFIFSTSDSLLLTSNWELQNFSYQKTKQFIVYEFRIRLKTNIIKPNHGCTFKQLHVTWKLFSNCYYSV